MFTDMVGYTALGQRNESLSIVLVEEQRRVIRPILQRHHGREVKTIGDAFLVEFPSALEAVRCAYEIQRSVKEFNLSQEEDRRIHLRIGVHLGDVVESQGDISGDAVNVSSRIEPLAEDGGVCFTRQVYDQVHGKLEVPLSSMGPKSLKNVIEPVEVFRMLMPWEKVDQAQATELDPNRVAVLPFVSISPDPNDEYFADGMTEELISRVSSIPELNVISRTSVMRYKDKSKPIEEIGRELRAGTILEGSIRKADSFLRVTAQLIDASNDKHLWSQSYDRELKNVFAIQGDIAQSVADAMKVRLLGSGRTRVERVPTNNMSAYDSYLRGVSIGRKWENQIKSIPFFEEAIRLDPSFADAYARLGNVYVVLSGDYMPHEEAFDKAEALIGKALELDGNSSEAHLAKGNIALQKYLDYEASRKELIMAIQLNPSNADAHNWLGTLYRLIGDHDAALKEARLSQELDPMSSRRMFGVAVQLSAARLYSEAARILTDLVSAEPDSPHFRLGMAWVLAILGDKEKARAEAESAKRLAVNNPLDRVWLSQVLALCGMEVEARAMLQEMEAERADKRGFFSRTQLAVTYAWLGERNRALELLEEDFSEARVSLLMNYQFADFDSIRNDPRFVSMVEGLNLPRRPQ